MSVQNVSWVFNNSPYNLGSRLVHLALADSANDSYGSLLWDAQSSIARKAGVSRQTVHSTMRQMVEDGYLDEVTDGNDLAAARLLMRDKRAKVYRFLMCKKSDTSERAMCKKSDTSERAMCKNDDGLCVKTTDSHLLLTQEDPKSAKTRSRRKPETPFPVGQFRITPEMRAWVAKEGYDHLDLRYETKRFKDHALANDRRQRDWVAAWRMWISNAGTKFNPKPQVDATARLRASR